MCFPCSVCPLRSDPPRMQHQWIPLCLRCRLASFPPVLVLDAFPKTKASYFLSFEAWNRIKQEKKKSVLCRMGFYKKPIESTPFVLKTASPCSHFHRNQPPVPGSVPAAAGGSGMLAAELCTSHSGLRPIALADGQLWSSAVCLAVFLFFGARSYFRVFLDYCTYFSSASEF